MKAINPFNDPEFKKSILEKEGRLDSDQADYEVISEPNNDISKDLKNIISSRPVIPKTAKNLILDATAISNNEKEQKAAEINLALNNVFSQYNKEYGTDLQIDFNSLSNTLVNVADPKSRHILELYLSEVFQSVRPILILHMISKLSLCIEYILDPKRMFGGEMTVQDIFIATEKIMQYISQLEDMKSEIVTKGSDLELKKLAEEHGDESISSPESKRAVDEFMKLFMKDSGVEE